MEIDYSYLSVLDNYLLIVLQHKRYKVYLSGKDCNIFINFVGHLNQYGRWKEHYETVGKFSFEFFWTSNFQLVIWVAKNY